MDTTPHLDNCDPRGERPLQSLPSGVTIGARVLVRSQRWQLNAVEAHDDCCALHLTSDEEAETRVLLWPFDRAVADRPRSGPVALRKRAWFHHVRETVVRDRPAIHLLAPHDMVMPAILPYQLVPALDVVAGSRRVLLADEVGLGKTVQAGWIVADTVARQPDARVLVAVPAGLRSQWAGELSRLFGLDAVRVDARWVMSALNDLPANINIWTPPGIYLISLDFLKRPDIAASLIGVTWDLLVVDEAHVAAAPTDRHRALDPIAERSRIVTLITATPFSGDDASFASLLSLGSAGDASPPKVFRRSRADIGDTRRRRHRFVRVRLSSSEQRLQAMLHRYCCEVWTHAPSAEGRLAAIVLRKRALSSPAALGRSLRRRLRLLSTSEATAVQLSLFSSDVDEEDDEPSGVLGAPGFANISRERAWLERLIKAIDHTGATNSKLNHLTRLLRRLGGESAIVFTEFRDTLSDLADHFPSSLRIHGGMTPKERDDTQHRFNASGGLLFATDAAAYGLNLHGRCRVVVNFELPWSPARLEQRIGRVDRIGQARPVHATTLVAGSTAEDLVVANLARRLWRIAHSFGQADRLAALLDDARVAGMVVGGEPICEVDTSYIPVLTEVPVSAVDEAIRLQAETGAASTRRPSRRSRNADLAVSSICGSSKLPPGVLTILQWTLREPSGRLIACRTLALHAAGRQHRPRTAADVKRIALDFLSRHANRLRERATRELQPMRDTSREAHMRAVQAQLDRELRFLAADHARDALQRGLFDHRAERDLEIVETRTTESRRQASRQIQRLRSASNIEDRIDVCALLVVWDES